MLLCFALLCVCGGVYFCDKMPWLSVVAGGSVTGPVPVSFPAILEQLHKQENVVLEYWTMKKKKLDQCNQFVLFERSAKQVRLRLYISQNLATIWQKK